VESPLFSGPFLLTELLLPMLMHSQSARIIMVSSELHKYGDIAEKIEMMDDKSRWSVYGSYNHTKLANV
jgi:NAD(P)-dependent dehydrogenase (short-subunit alcohol dehydrogenase family)